MRSEHKAPSKRAGKQQTGKAQNKTQKKHSLIKPVASGKKTIPPASTSSASKSTSGVSSNSAAQGRRGAKVALISSELAYRGPLFDVYTDYVREPGGETARRDVIRHSGSVVILAVDDGDRKSVV